MSFTTLTTVRKHLLSSGLGTLHMENLSVTLEGTADVELPHFALLPSSETVKRDVSVTVGDSGPHTLADYNWSSLETDQIVPRSVVVTLDSSCQTRYTEEADYQVDYEGGRIRRVPGSAIANFTPVLVYYVAYARFVADTDYELDYALGRLHRLESGGLADGATVLVDYDVTAGSVEDALIQQAITEVEDVIVRNLAPGYSAESTDQGLTTGATYLSLSVIARALCTEFLARRTTSDGATRAKEWISLSERYEAKAYEVLRPFLNPISLRAGLRLMNE